MLPETAMTEWILAGDLPAPLATGRHGGRVTGRALPDAPRDLPEELRRGLAERWLSQAATELRVARSFALVHDALVAEGADGGLIAIASRAVDDEHRHTALCLELGKRFIGTSELRIPLLPFSPPTHEAAESDELRRALHVMGQCVFNETFASAYLSAALDGATDPLAKAALRELLSDEIDHARVGWAYVLTLEPRLRAGVRDWLFPLAYCNLREWRTAIGSAPREEDGPLVAHGFPSRSAAETALVGVLRDLIVPSLREQGLRSPELERWVERGATAA